MICQINFPSEWINASALEKALRGDREPHGKNSYEVRFLFPVGCKIMVDAAVRLLSLINQLDYCSRRVRLEFEEGEIGTMGYLNRMGFFDCLSKNVDVLPGWPTYSGASMYGGSNTRLVEIARISPEARDLTLPTRLADAVVRSRKRRKGTRGIKWAAWTIFAELIDNIFSHSQTPLDGYAALQVYPKGESIMVAVSDSGLGIMETLRPALATESPARNRLSDIDLLVEIFREGISRHGTGRGCGLKGSAAKAIKYNADLDVRLPMNRVLLVPGQEGYRPNTAYCYANLPLVWGTHICFTFHLA